MATAPETHSGPSHQLQVPTNVTAHQHLLQQYRDTEYFYVYVAESENSNVGHWILLEPDKTLSLQTLRTYYSTCFGIKYKILNIVSEVETKYIRYHNGYFRFPGGIDMNNTRFVAYYYDNPDDVKGFMEMINANDGGPGSAPTLEVQKKPEQTVAEQPAPEQNNNESTLLGRTAFAFEMEKVQAQSTPTKQPATAVTAYVSSTSDVILNEPTVENITVHDSQSQLNDPNATVVPAVVKPKEAPKVSGVRAKLGPAVTSSSEVPAKAQVKDNDAKKPRSEWKPISVNDSSGFQREKSSVMVKPVAAPKEKNMLNRYQRTRPPPEDVNEKTPLKITLKTRGRQAQRNTKILKIEDEKGRTTALLTKRKWAPKSSTNSQKRRASPEDEEEERYEKRRKYDNHHQQQQHQQYYRYAEPKAEPVVNNDYYRTLNVLLVGFHTTAPIIHETTRYFAEFGIVQNLQLYTLDNWRSHPEYYAFMTIRTDDAVSLFSDRHLYNGTVIYAIRVDDNRLPARLTCKVCGYQGLIVGHLHYHFGGQFHQSQLQKRLDALAGTVRNIYRDSYYRITHEEVYAQFPNDAIQEMVRNDYWKRARNSGMPSSVLPAGPSNRYYSTERERYY